MSIEPLTVEAFDESAEKVRQDSGATQQLKATINPNAKRTFASIGFTVLAIGLVLASIAVGWNFWTEWFSGIDRILCTLFAAIGFTLALVQCHWKSEQPPRILSTSFLFGCSFAILAFALVSGRSKLAGISMGLAAAAWLCYRIRGESVMNAISLGLFFTIPSFVDACKDRNLFQASEWVALQIASGLSDAFGHSHLSEQGGIRFGHGLFNQFACEGRWDSIITYLGISCLCIYAFRRQFLAGLITLSLAFAVWMAIRGAACVAVAQYASVYGVWPEWTVTSEIILFVIGLLLMFSLDNFFGVLLRPIPVEHVNPDFPLFALSWNWLVNLPNFTVEVPERLSDSPVQEEEEYQ